MRNQTTHPARRRNTGAAGFTLIELLIVVAVILVIAAIAIPNFIASKMRANETSAAENLRTITTAEVVYNTTYGSYSPDLPSLGGTSALPSASSAELIDEVLASGTRSGYVFTYTVTSTDVNGNTLDFTLNADPVAAGTTGQRHFYTDQTAVIRVNVSTTAGPSDPPIQ